MALGVFSSSFFKPCVPLPNLAHKALFLPLDRNTNQARSISVTRAGDKMKLFSSINALLLHRAANCIIMDTSFHIWLNLFSEMNDRVIYGYWMSPDLEDGWGFVEAAVDIPH